KWRPRHGDDRQHHQAAERSRRGVPDRVPEHGEPPGGRSLQEPRTDATSRFVQEYGGPCGRSILVTERPVRPSDFVDRKKMSSSPQFPHSENLHPKYEKKG